jgi:glycosyltransferase involved in cell wall biosynthesis
MTRSPLPDSGLVRPVPLGPLTERPLVSVVVSNHNYGRYVGAAIQSVLAQTYTHFEMVICDDGSTDDSCEVIESWCRKDARVRLIRQDNKGQGSAMNTAFSMAKGEVIALLDSDDLAHEQRLELVVRAFQQYPEIGMVTHALRILDQQGRHCGRDPEEPLDEGWLAPALLRGPEPVFPPTSGLALRMEVAKRVYPMPWPRVSFADWNWAVREGAAFLAPVGAIDDTLGSYRLHGSNVFGHCRFTTLQDIDRRHAELTGAIKIRQIYAQQFLGTQPDEQVCNDVIGVLVLSRAALCGERLSRSEISKYSRGKSRWIWSLLFLLPSWLQKRIYLYGRKTQVPLKARRLKGQTVRLLESLAATLGKRWKPGRRVHQTRD